MGAPAQEDLGGRGVFPSLRPASAQEIGGEAAYKRANTLVACFGP